MFIQSKGWSQERVLHFILSKAHNSANILSCKHVEKQVKTHVQDISVESHITWTNMSSYSYWQYNQAII